MKSKQKTSSAINSTTTPNNPEWVTNGVQDFVGRVGALAGQDPQSFVSGPSDLQQQQFGLASGLGAQGFGQLDSAAGMASAAGGYQPQQVTGATAFGGIGSYLNPFTEMVIGQGLRDNERARQMAGIDTAAAAQAAHAFGGSRHGVADALTNEAYDKNALGFIGSNLNQGFNTALQAANQDADRSQQANLANQSAGLAAQGLGLNAAQLLGNIGQFGLGYLNDTGQAQYGVGQAQAEAPLNVLQRLAGIQGSLPLGLFQGQTTNGTQTATTTTSGSPLQALGGLIGGLGTVGMGLGALGWSPFGKKG
jgi:hypothetical protein